MSDISDNIYKAGLDFISEVLLGYEHYCHDVL